MAPAGGRAEFSVGKVLGDTFSTYFGNFIPFTLLGIVIYVPYLVAIAALAGGLVASTQSSLQLIRTYGVVAGLASFLVTFVLGAFVTAGITYGSIEHMSGRRYNFGALLGRAFRAFIPVAFASLLVGIIIGLGLMLLIVPGIILYLMFAVTIPVIVAETEGPTDAMGRSSRLTSGYRWGILGGYIVCLILLMAVSFVLALVIGALAAAGGGLAGSIVLTIVSLLSNSISAGISGCFAAAVYVSLRQVKEGAGIEELASVFD